jgi:hypothetical protein
MIPGGRVITPVENFRALAIGIEAHRGKGWLNFDSYEKLI